MDHHFEPSEYHSTFGSHLAVLTIEAGDRVITSTADAAGIDRHGELVGPPGNPLTGPIAVEGAARGDMLVVQLERI